MRVYYILFLVLQAVVLIEAAEPPGKINWTLHKSCYRNQDDTADDNDLAKAIVDTVNTVKAWAKRASDKLSDSFSSNLLKGKATKEAMIPLIGEKGYKDKAKEIRDKIRDLGRLTGPIGEDGGDGKKYDQSDAWGTLANSDTHWQDFLIVCRPELTTAKDYFGVLDVPFDVVRKNALQSNRDFEKMLNEAKTIAKWEDLKNSRIQAITMRDIPGPPEGDRTRIPETITFHPLWLKYQRDRNWNGWTEEMFNKVTAKDALEVFKKKGQEIGFDARPVDALLDSSFTRNMFHEMFHLSAFGGMGDDWNGAYGWADNVKNKNTNNPDYFAIIAVVIELLNREGGRYKVSADGAVSRR